ncbi:MAG: hypothetical protein RIR00_2301 [Pseudomonadota bacterium]
MPRSRPTVFISSTSIDLPEHREKVRTACLDHDFFPDGMETWPAVDADAETLCLAKVDQADVFVGIYGHRYGWVPAGQAKSISELEYDRAGKRGIPRLLFVIDPDMPASIPFDEIESDAKREALRQFKARISGERVHKTFTNPDQLRAEVVNALVTLARESVPFSPRESGRGEGARPPRIELSHLPKGAPHFLGREVEMAMLDEAWAAAGTTTIVQLIAPGGTGKTALVSRWLDSLRATGWRGAEKVFGWSFYSQGSDDKRQASEDGFFEAALKWFGVDIAPAASPWDKGAALAQAVAASRSLLVLDGLEPLQYPPTAAALAGELKAPGLQTLLQTLARNGQPGLVLLTSREHLADLAEWVRNPDRSDAGVVALDLGNLCEADGARLLWNLGVKRAGAAAIPNDDEELQEASRAVRGHALTLQLLGSYLNLGFDGDVRQRNQVNFREADEETQNGHAFRVMAAYETWFEREGEKGARYLAAFRLLGFFDRLASRNSLRALRSAPAIAGLTRPLVTLKPEQWQATLKKLEACGLARFDTQTGSLDAHPLIREYLAHALRSRQPEAWREGHKRIYEQLKRDTKPHRPDGLAGLQPLYQAVAHGCLAGLQQQACDEVYVDRILRGMGHDGFYSTKKLGAFAADLGAVACFFDSPWSQPAAALREATQAWLLNEAAFSLRALGRLDEALQPMRATAEINANKRNWKNAAISYSNLSQLQLSLGRLAAAVMEGRAAVDHAERSGDAFQRMTKRVALADALHQHGEPASAEFEEAEKAFQAAEALQAERQPNYPLLYSLQGFRYCDLLLAKAERLAWCRGELVRPLPNDPLRANKFAPTAVLQSCAVVQARAAQTLAWVSPQNWLLDIALDHLTLARCALYAGLIQGQPPDPVAQDHAKQALAGLRAAGQSDYLPHGLLTRAWLRASLNDSTGAQADLADLADLDEAQRIAERGNMKLHQADIALHRARLFADREALTKARTLIEECKYFRRLPELADAEERAKAESWGEAKT